MRAALTRPGGRTTSTYRGAKPVEIPPGMAAEIYRLGLNAGKRAGEGQPVGEGDGGYWKGYADGMNDGLAAAAATPAHHQPCPVPGTAPYKYGRRSRRPAQDGGVA